MPWELFPWFRLGDKHCRMVLGVNETVLRKYEDYDGQEQNDRKITIEIGSETRLNARLLV